MELLLLECTGPGDSKTIGVFDSIEAIQKYLQTQLEEIKSLLRDVLHEEAKRTLTIETKKLQPKSTIKEVSRVQFQITGYGAENKTGVAAITYDYRLKPSRRKGFRTDQQVKEQVIDFEWRTIVVNQPL